MNALPMMAGHTASGGLREHFSFTSSISAGAKKHTKAGSIRPDKVSRKSNQGGWSC